MADGSGTGLVLGTIAPISGVQPGSTFEAPVTFGNKGTEALQKVWLRYTVTRGLDYADVPSNCVRWDIHSYDELPPRSQLTCEFDQAVEPGVVYAPEKLPLKALDRALYDDLDVAVGDYDFGADEGARGPVRGTAPAAKLVERPGSVLTGSSSGNYAEARVRVNAANTADFQVSGAQVKGRVGDTIDLQVKFTNAGPAWVLVEPGPPVPTRVLIKIPSGTTAVKAPPCKKPAAGTYECYVAQGWVEEDQVNTYSFKLKIDKAVSGAKGSVALNAESRPYDVNKANDKADILLDVDGSGSAGGSGSSDGGGTPRASGTTGSSSATGSSGSASATGGDLAATGSGPALPFAGAAAAVVAAGAGTVLLVRRRAARR
ncbi:hypothetical protein [Streptomyces gilvus]|uniref:hypothetical protein n=1 Tax=Streptomyces gilvus TaxID=2920937 RepID=UPI001F0D7529|nr:hypothetical protein [Streptomyces sp. CME 23]MCH5676877.1 hypothetical protein [Streptomyces sp. CME 23]